MTSCPLNCGRSLDPLDVLDHFVFDHQPREVAEALFDMGARLEKYVATSTAAKPAGGQRTEERMLRALRTGMTLREWSSRSHHSEDLQTARQLVRSGRVIAWCPKHQRGGRCTAKCGRFRRFGVPGRSS